MDLLPSSRIVVHLAIKESPLPLVSITCLLKQYYNVRHYRSRDLHC